MDTVRELMALLKADKVTVDDVAKSLRGLSLHGLSSRKRVSRSTSLEDSYSRAENMPDDNDTFWIDVAYSQHVIKYPDYRNLIEALASDPGRAAAPSGGGEVSFRPAAVESRSDVLWHKRH